MKKNIFKTMFIAAAAFAFASCSKDATTDMTPSRELSGLKKTISLNAGFAGETRTELSTDHQLTWSEDDVFGILAADAQGVWENIPVAIKDGEKAEGGYYFESIEVPEETEIIYCYYPYSANYDNLNDINEFVINIPQYYSSDPNYQYNYDEEYAGGFLPEFHYMAAQSAVTDDEVTITFTPLVSIVEFNLYDTTESGEKINSLYFDGGFGCNICGEFTVDFETNELTEMLNGNTFDSIEILLSEENALSLGASKDEGAKVYMIVRKDKYESASLLLGSVDHEISSSESNYFTNLEWQNGTSFTADGHTVNIDLKHALPAPLVEILPITANNTFYVSAPVKVYDDCDFIAVYAYESKYYDEQTFRDTAKAIYDNFKNDKMGDYSYIPLQCAFYEGFYDERDGYENWDWSSDGKRQYMIIPVEGDAVHYDGYLRNGNFDLSYSNNKAFKANTEYTYAVYAVAYGANHQHPEPEVYTANFTTPEIEISAGGDLHIEVATQGLTATATVTGTNIKQVVTWVASDNLYTNAKPTDGQITVKNLSDALSVYHFEDFESGMTFTQENMSSTDHYYFCAAAITDDYKIIVSNVGEADAPELNIGSASYKITDVELNSQPTGFGASELKFTTSGNPKYLRVYSGYYSDIDGTPGSDTSDEIKAKTWEEVQDIMLNSTFYRTYADAEVEGDGTCTVNVILPRDDKPTVDTSGGSAVDPTETPSTGRNRYYIFVVAADEKGELTSELSNIYQITGEYNNPTINELTDDYIHGVDKDDDTHTPENDNAYYFSCPESEHAVENVEESIDWFRSANSFTTMWMSGQLCISSYNFSNLDKVWVIKVGEYSDKVSEIETTWGGEQVNWAQQTAHSALDPIFAKYDGENVPDDADVIYTITSPFTTTGTYNNYVYSQEAADAMTTGGLYVIIGQDKTDDEKAGGKLLYGYIGFRTSLTNSFGLRSTSF